MVEASQIREILSLYRKHGWRLERILWSEALREKVAAELTPDFGNAETVLSEIDAAWFSRPAQNGGATWELRHLSANPYALLEVFDADDDEDVREEALMEIEEKIKESVSKRKKEGH